MNKRLLHVLAIVMLVVAASGCATRRYVRNRTQPLDQQVSELDKRTNANSTRIGELDDKTSREIARVSEKANSADSRAQEAAQRAQDAITKASQAMEQANSARTLAENSSTRTGQLEKYLDNYENFQVSASKTILFEFDQSTVTADAKKELDDLAQSLANNKRYVIEVQGFTDKTGPSAYNYALSQRRAAAVVRYLTEKHQIPLYRVHTIGLGSDMHVEGRGREAQRMSRRAEVKVYSRPELPR